MLFSGNALAHPGHGMPGWLHPHAGEYGLILLGMAAVAGVVYAVKKIRSRK
jgi:hypothetical protein